MATQDPIATATVTPVLTPSFEVSSALVAIPTPLPALTPTLPGIPDAYIDCVLFDGEVPRPESDEYVQITNHGDGQQDPLGWVLYDEASPDRQRFSFEDSYTLGLGGTIRVYTKEVHVEWGGFSFGNCTAILSNSNADTAVLRDTIDTVVCVRDL